MVEIIPGRKKGGHDSEPSKVTLKDKRQDLVGEAIYNTDQITLDTEPVKVGAEPKLISLSENPGVEEISAAMVEVIRMLPKAQEDGALSEGSVTLESLEKSSDETNHGFSDATVVESILQEMNWQETDPDNSAHYEQLNRLARAFKIATGPESKGKQRTREQMIDSIIHEDLRTSQEKEAKLAEIEHKPLPDQSLLPPLKADINYLLADDSVDISKVEKISQEEDMARTEVTRLRNEIAGKRERLESLPWYSFSSSKRRARKATLEAITLLEPKLEVAQASLRDILNESQLVTLSEDAIEDLGDAPDQLAAK
jgi:hypothetical protein